MPLLPAFAHLVLTAGRTARRFPLPLLCAGALCVAGCYTVRYSNQQTAQAGWIFPLLSASALGLPLTLALSLVAERYGWPRLVRWATLAGALALLAGWYALAPALPTVVWWMRLLVLLLGLHLLVAAAPYLAELRRDADTPGFWRYNETLLLRLLTGGLYTGVLYAGSALALVAVRELFGVYFEGDVFGYLLVVLTTLFNTWFFLAGVPADVAALEQPAPYPRGLQLFAQFVLLPLVTLYVVILYVYLLRIVLRWELPQGWVAVLILALAVAGIFALLLIHPLRHHPDQAWMRAFARWFYRALFPLLGLLAVAIGTRIQAYGLTEERYYVVLLAAWLLGMAGYFLWRRGQGILWVPVTLAALAFLSVAGPWSAFALAERSQLRQLRILTEQHHLLRDGRLDGAARRAPDLPRRVHGRLASVFAFFAERDALARLQPQFAGSLQLPDSLRTADPWLQADWRLSRPFELSGFERLESYELQYALNEEPERQSIRFYVSEPPRYYSLGPGQYWLRDIGASAGLADTTGSVTLELTVPEGHFRLLTSAAGDSVLLQQQQPAGPWRTQLYLPLQAPVDSLVRRYGRNRIRDVDLPAPVVLQARAQRVQLRLFVTALTRERTDSVDRYAYSAEGMLRIQP